MMYVWFTLLMVNPFSAQLFLLLTTDNKKQTPVSSSCTICVCVYVFDLGKLGVRLGESHWTRHRAEVTLKAQTTMTHRLFEERHHAALYHKYRFSPPGEVKDIIIQYLNKKVRYVRAQHMNNAWWILLPKSIKELVKIIIIIKKNRLT